MSATSPVAGDRMPGDHWDGAPVLYDIVDEDGTIVVCNRTQAEALGYSSAEQLVGRSLGTVYPRESAARILGLLGSDAPTEAGEALRLRMRRRDREIVEVAASVNGWRLPDGRRALRLIKTRVDPLLQELASLQRENTTLHGMIATARDACWCIEFVEPVDMSAPDAEIIRQVFENESSWRFCNRAMARLYGYPDDLDFHVQDVRLLFPHNRENEAFVQQLIDSGFHIDGAPSLDRRYDGLPLHADNDVRGYIRDGHLHRMWGVVRDLSETRRRELELSDQVNAMLDVLSSLPDPVLVVSADGTVEGANPALEWALGWSVDTALGRSVRHLLSFPDGLDGVLAGARAGVSGPPRPAIVHRADGSSRQGWVSVGAIVDTAPTKRVVLTLRVESGELRRRGDGAAGVDPAETAAS